MTPSLRRQGGFSFFEVLIAALVLGIGVLGFAALQVRALDTTGFSHFRAQAAVLAADLAERVRMADTGLAINHNNYEVATWWDPAQTEIPEDPPASWTQGTETCIYAAIATPGCTEANLVRADVMEVQFMARQLLPAGNVSVRACEAGSDLTCVFVAWRGQDSRDCELGDGNAQCLGVQVYF